MKNKGKQLSSPIIPFMKGDEHKWFTLVEIMIWILIFSVVIIAWFKAYNWILVWKIKLIESTNIQKEAFYFSEKFFEEIKVGWTIDYEEYFNRSTVWISTSSWHYDKLTWFWNYWTDKSPWNALYWNWFYYCRSEDWTLMWTWWCVKNFNTVWDTSWKPQRYGQYSFHFIDYNSNIDDDWTFNLWDEDWDGNIIWDDDDEYLGIWPDSFSWTLDQKEIYLISADKKKRTFFRWNIKQDETISTETRWTIEFLKLEWKDWWFNHLQTWTGLYDWVIDTWVIDKDFSWKTNIDKDNAIIAWGALDTWFWQPLFWDNINVSDVEFYLYPNKDLSLSWKDFSDNINISPYLKIKMTLSPSYKTRRWFRWKIPEIKINTTINLTDIYSR